MSNLQTHAKPLSIVFPIYPGVTHLDFTGPHQFFARLAGVKPIVASIEGKPVTADGLTFSGLVPLEQVDHCDVLCVPAGLGCTEGLTQPRPCVCASQDQIQNRKGSNKLAIVVFNDYFPIWSLRELQKRFFNRVF